MGKRVGVSAGPGIDFCTRSQAFGHCVSVLTL
jgi:hypothetical protein